MRYGAALALSLLALTSLNAQNFPPPVTPEVRVSAVVPTTAAGSQSNPHIAGNGQDALLVWVDTREGAYAIYGSRIDSNGNALDPLGVRLTTGYFLNAVAWNGDSFVVIVGTNVTLVSPDLTTITTKTLPIPSYSTYIAATTGADPRFLFFERNGKAAIVDGHGNVFVEVALAPASGGFTVGGGNDNSFLLLYNNLAYHVDRDGNLLSVIDANIGNLSVRQFPVLTGGPDGFILAGYQGPNDTKLEVAVHWFTLAGVRTSSRVLAPVDPANTPTGLTVMREGNHYLVAWLLGNSDGSTTTESVAVVGSDDASTPATVAINRTALSGRAGGLAIATAGGTRLAASSLLRPFTEADVVVQTIPASLQPASPAPATSSGVPQTVSAVAAGGNGYAVAWFEQVDAYVPKQGVLRRFSEHGVAQDAAPIPFVTATTPSQLYLLRTAIVSNGGTYLVAWLLDQTYYIRRLDALRGDWIDPEPVALDLLPPVSFASKGTDALAVGRCAAGGCLAARRIALVGPPLASPATAVRPLAANTSAAPALTSNGTDYLAAWIEDPVCMLECGIPPGRIFALRLRADGTALDPQPAQLSVQDRSVSDLTAAWADDRYLVAWTDSDGIRGTRMTSEGAVLDHDAIAGGVLLAAADPRQHEFLHAAATAVGKQFALALKYQTSAADGPLVSVEGLAFDAHADLAAVRALKRAILSPAEDDAQRNVAVAGRGNALLAAYDHLDPDAGNVPRVFIREFGGDALPRHRAAGRR